MAFSETPGFSPGRMSLYLCDKLSLSMLKEKQVALAMILHDGKLLIVERKDQNPQWDHKWEFPGGKVEVGETHHQTVKREVLEETGIALNETRFLGIHSHDWNLPNGDVLRVHLHCHLAHVEQEVITFEQDHAYQYKWIDPPK
ncbi:MAG: NUDIX domain-containing protein, partial [Actinobacteria bacterium]|nr:NUDIX domain-containing protein [Actinomycetota bacterium]